MVTKAQLILSEKALTCIFKANVQCIVDVMFQDSYPVFLNQGVATHLFFADLLKSVSKIFCLKF